MTSEAPIPPEFARYSRQMLIPSFGVSGQQRLRHASVTLVGCGALGSVLASTLVRAGVGALRIIDRDFIELVNLQRQMLFDEHDVAHSLPKAEAAARKLRKINSQVEIEAHVADVHPENIAALCGNADLLLDGTDNLETRFLINDFAVQQSLPWVFGAVLGVEGLVLAVQPGRSPCLRCIWDTPPPPGSVPTCDTAGILAPTVQAVAALQAIEALKLLTGQEAALYRGLLSVDVWSGRLRRIEVDSARAAGDCVCCGRRQFEFLSAQRTSGATRLCGRDAVQVIPPEDATRPPVDFRAVAERLPARAGAKYNEYLLRFQVEAEDRGGRGRLTVTVFPDGRAIVQGTSEPAVARATLAQYVGM